MKERKSIDYTKEVLKELFDDPAYDKRVLENMKSYVSGWDDCENIIIDGLTLDSPQTSIFGAITQIDYAGNRIEIQLAEGSRTETGAAHDINGQFRMIPFKAEDTRFICTSSTASNTSEVPSVVTRRKLWAGIACV